VNGKMENARIRALVERLTTHGEYGIGLEVSTQIIWYKQFNELRRRGIKRTPDRVKRENKRKGIPTERTEYDVLLDRKKATINRLRKKYNIPFHRTADTAYIADKQLVNEHIDRSLITHSMDYYRLSNGQISRMHHSRGNIWFDNECLLLGIIVNVETKQKYWMVWTDNSENTQRTIQLILKAQSNNEDIRYLQMDRQLNSVVKGCDEIGITVVVYGKSEAYPYNTEAEQCFGNISKCFYSIMDKLVEWETYKHTTKGGRTVKKRRNIKPIEEAQRLFEAIITVYYEYNDIPLMEYHEWINREIIEILPTVSTQKDKVAE